VFLEQAPERASRNLSVPCQSVNRDRLRTVCFEPIQRTRKARAIVRLRGRQQPTLMPRKLDQHAAEEPFAHELKAAALLHKFPVQLRCGVNQLGQGAPAHR